MSGDQQSGQRNGLAASAIALLTREAGRVPLRAVTIGLRAWEQSRPVRDLALRRGSEVLQIVAHTPLGRFLPQPVHDDDADAEAGRIAAAARQAVTQAADRAAKRPSPPPPPPPKLPKPAELPADVEVPKVEKDLPLPDFDNISIGSLRARLKPLSVEQLVALREWEQAHANRLNVITTLDNRIAKLGSETSNDTSTGTSAGKKAQTDVGPAGTDYPQEAKAAERAAEDEGGTLRV